MTHHHEKILKCRICGSSDNHNLYTVLEMMFGSGESFEYFECSQCKCLQIAEIPANISKYYPKDYYSFTPKKRKFQGNPVDTLLRRMKDRYTIFPKGVFGSLISSFSPNKKLACLSKLDLTMESRILDVGCGEGWRLHVVKDIGFRNVLGIDPYVEHDILYKNGLKVLKKTIHEITGEWDVVMYHHSFEHVPDPLENLRAVSKLMAKGGCCLIRIPTVSSYAWEHYREHWVQLDAPRHYMLPSLESMNILAAQAGFTVRDVDFDSTQDQFQASELYRRGISLSSGEKVFTASQVRKWKREAKKLNKEKRGDQAAFYLIKK